MKGHRFIWAGGFITLAAIALAVMFAVAVYQARLAARRTADL